MDECIVCGCSFEDGELNQFSECDDCENLAEDIDGADDGDLDLDDDPYYEY